MGTFWMKFSKNPLGSFKELPSGYFGGYFLKIPTPYPLGKRWANCFRTLHVLSMDPLGNWPLAPSDRRSNCGYPRRLPVQRVIYRSISNWPISRYPREVWYREIWATTDLRASLTLRIPLIFFSLSSFGACYEQKYIVAIRIWATKD